MINRQKACVFVLMGLVVLLSALPIKADESEYLKGYCSEMFEYDGVCDPTACALKCLGDLVYDGCTVECAPKTCIELDIKNCPKDACQILDNCAGVKSCHFKIEDEGMACGTLVYAGDQVECCDGYVKKCGFANFDGTCDMEGEGSMYGVPICLPCGDGICGPLENKCNCPEDCSKIE